MQDYQPLFVFDALKAHFCWAVWPLWANAQLWPLVVPARMTGFLQPLDTHGFAAFKMCLQRLFQDHRVDNFGDTDMLRTVLLSIIGAIQQVLEARPWAAAFADNGLSKHQQALGEAVKTKVGGAVVTATIADTRPTIQQLRHCFPKRAAVPEMQLFRPLAGYTAPLRARSSVERSIDLDAEEMHFHDTQPIASRTRSHSSSSTAPPRLPGTWPIAFRTRSRTAYPAQPPRIEL